MRIFTYSLFIPFIACSLLSFSKGRADVSNHSPNSFYTVTDNLSAIKNYANDSIRYSNDKNIISLIGDAKVVLKDITVVADAIVYNGLKQTLKVTNAIFLNLEEKMRKVK